LLAGYRVKILDGNHLAATEHRIAETRTLNSAPLPGQALVVLDPQLRLVLDVIPCEDAHAQERSLLDEVLPSFETGDLVIADRNFCCTRFVFGLRARQAAFLIRQHASTLSGKRLLGKRTRVGRCDSGMVYEQEMEIHNPQEAEPQKQVMRLRRITIELDEPTRQRKRPMRSPWPNSTFAGGILKARFRKSNRPCGARSKRCAIRRRLCWRSASP
jgi:hypothetical protein